MSKVIILNGPPNSGKDVGAEYLCDIFDGSHKEFKGMLFKATKAAFGVPDDVWEELYTRENKELPSYYLINNGVPISPRQAMINTSEEVVKPLFGNDAFGIALANNLGEGLNFVSDGGFADEIAPVVEKVGAHNILILRIHRSGCTFEGDSRNYICYADVDEDVTILDVDNDGTLNQYLSDLEGKIEEWLE